MIKLLKLLLLLPIFAVAQINIDNQWKNSVNPIFQNLDKTKIQSKLLLDYAMEFTDVTAYNGVLTDTTFVDANIMGDIYKTIFMSKVVADTVTTPLFDRYAYNWAKARFKATKDSSSVYVLSGLLYEYQRFNPNALAQNKISIISDKYYDKFVGGVWQNPYETLKTFALTTPTQQSRSKKVYFKLPNNLLLSNIKNQIASIQINADNGLGYVNFPYDTALQLQFFENKIHNITYKITLTNSQVLLCQSKFKIDDPTLDNLQQRGAIPVTNERIYIHEDGNFFNAAWLTIKRIPGNTGITRPFIIAEGLDTGNFTAPEDFGGDTTLKDFLKTINNSGNLLPLIDINNNSNDYDIIYIDWVRGMADMRSNSKVLEEVIKWVNAQKVISGSTQPNVLLGQSMGGVIGRYTLARMEKENKPHNVQLFIAHDSPMQGANTPLSVQHFANHMRQEYTNSPLIWTLGEVVEPIGFGLAQLGSDILNFFGANTSGVPTFVTPQQLLSLQDQTASRQLNYWSAVAVPFGSQIQTKSYNETWQQTLTTMGWPQQSRNVAISNGYECNVNNGFAPGAPLLVINSRSNPGFWLDMLNVVLAPITGVVTTDIGLVLVGALPGRSRWQTNFDFNSYGDLGAQNLIYRGRIRFEKKLLWIGPTINYNLTNKSFNAPATALPFETYSGGVNNFLNGEGEFAVDVPILTNLINVVNPKYGFIPVVSALDIKRNNGQVIPSDYLKKYAGGVTPESALTTGFHNFIVDYNSGNTLNNKHISFQVRNGNWLAEELNVNATNPTYPVYNCLFICNDAKINGADVLCTTATYNAPTGAPLYNWSITQGSNLVTLTGNGTPSVTITSLPNVSGAVTLSLTMGDDGVKCGNITLTKTIWVGVPKFNSLEPIGNQNGYNPNEPNLSISPDGDGCNQIKLKAIFDSPSILEYQWEKITTDVSWSVSPNSGLIYLYPQCNQNFSFKVRARNSCGWSEWYQFDYFMNRCTIACNTSIPIINTGLNFTLNPNPVTNEILNINVKNNAPWFIIPVNIGNGNNFDISNEFGETNYQLIPNISVNISIFNQLGTPVLQFPNMPVHPTPAELNLSSLQSGTYMVVFEYEGQEESYTIIKN